MILLDELELPPYLRWDDEFAWSPVQQAEEFSTTGALLLDISVKQAGRPMTLVGTEHLGWITRATLLQLQALADTHAEMEIDYHDRIFAVRFRYDGGGPVTADKIIPRIPEKDTDPYRNLRINLIIVG
jgi:hypothetical protein